MMKYYQSWILIVLLIAIVVTAITATSFYALDDPEINHLIYPFNYKPPQIMPIFIIALAILAGTLFAKCYDKLCLPHFTYAFLIINNIIIFHFRNHNNTDNKFITAIVLTLVFAFIFYPTAFIAGSLTKTDIIKHSE